MLWAGYLWRLVFRWQDVRTDLAGPRGFAFLTIVASSDVLVPARCRPALRRRGRADRGGRDRLAGARLRRADAADLLGTRCRCVR
ncbi:hypothetical protein ACFQV4_25940 [Streptomyces thermocarboxydus]